MALVGEIVRIEVADDGCAAAVEDAVRAIENVHNVPGNAPVVTVVDDAELPSDGRYDAGLIQIHPLRPRRRLAFAHEFGHYLDDSIFSTGDRLGTASPEFEPWRAEVIRTDAIIHLRQLAQTPPHIIAVAHITYLLTFTEAFARSYAEWIAIRSGSESLLDELGEALSALNYGEHWGFDDFDPVGAALDAIFADLTP